MTTNNSIPQRGGIVWTPRKLWITRIVLLVLILVWVSLWFYVHRQVVQARAKVEQHRIEALHRAQRAQREALYQQQMDQRQNMPRVRNVMDR